MEKKDKIVLGGLSLTILGGLTTIIYCWGQAKYYEGRITKYHEMKPIVDFQQNLIDEIIKKGV